MIANISQHFNKLDKRTRVIAHTVELFHERNELLAIIELLETNHNKILVKLRAKISKINEEINNNDKILNI